MHSIVSGLYVGNKEAACDEIALSKLNITRVVSLGCTVPRFNNVDYLCYPLLLDTPETLILDCLPDATRFIADSIKKDASILVHCVYGQSRSCTAVLAYLLFCGQTIDSSIALLSERNPSLCINPGFLSQLYFIASRADYGDSLELALLRGPSVATSTVLVGSKRKESKTSDPDDSEGSGKLVCKQCRYQLASLDAIISRSYDVAPFVTKHIDGFWKGYQPVRPKASGPLTRLPIKGTWAVFPSDWMLDAISSSRPTNQSLSGGCGLDNKGTGTVVMNVSVDIDKEAEEARPTACPLRCPGCGSEVGAFAPRQLDLIGVYNPCDLYTLAEAAVRRVRTRNVPPY
jgi:hypothetical protein